MRICVTVFVFSCLCLAACVEEPSSPCEVAADRLRECAGAAPSGWDDSCDDEKAGEVLVLSCDELARAMDDGKLDGVWGKKDGDPCTFNFQCAGELVCRPLSNVIWTEQVCMARSEHGWCDSDYDCSEGRYCCMEHVLENGSCGPAGPHC